LLEGKKGCGQVTDLDVAGASFQVDEARNQQTIAQDVYGKVRRSHYNLARCDNPRKTVDSNW
jgi:hypothetical protein